ncbi:hypothetical protein Anapl_17366 [Anas platyrhynchos]|uniref:Uncharacterized protein n=1 Tax=Anas platyrhynchos TaxID=8839 RepID=R0J8E3_ANAPL|nr:hypothetical protein Anapl_17366 [Anas platyrhynchos]
MLEMFRRDAWFTSGAEFPFPQQLSTIYTRQNSTGTKEEFSEMSPVHTAPYLVPKLLTDNLREEGKRVSTTIVPIIPSAQLLPELLPTHSSFQYNQSKRASHSFWQGPAKQKLVASPLPAQGLASAGFKVYTGSLIFSSLSFDSQKHKMPFGMPKSFHESAGNLIDVLVVAAELTAEVILPEQHVNPIFYY